jgi:hypothetical protein
MLLMHLDYAITAEDHLRWHLTDGRWHDDCRWCLERRVHGGTGVPLTGWRAIL